MTRLAFVLGIFLLLVGVWAMLPSTADRALPFEEVPGPDAQEQLAPALQASGDAEPRAATAQEGLFERSAVEAEVAALRDGAEMTSVLVVNRETREPLPGAEVHYMTEVENETFMRELEDDQAEMRNIWLDPERMMRRFGKQLSADSEGRVYLPPVASASLVGRHGDLFGQLGISRNNPWATKTAEDGHVLELEHDLTLLVKVTDSQGDPAVDVPIAVAPTFEDERSAYVGETARTVAPDGIASIRHVQFWTRAYRGGQAAPSGFVLRALVPGLTDADVPFDAGAPPEEPLVLQLPPTGSVVVKSVDGSGRPLLTNYGVSLALAPEDRTTDLSRFQPPSDGQWHGERGEGGATTFDRVVAGKTYFARSFLGVDIVAERLFVAADREVHVTLSTGEASYVMVGRAIDGGREPIPETEFQLTYEYGGGQGSIGFRTDSDGFFRVPIQRAERQITLTRITIQQQARGRPRPADAFSYSSAEERRLVAGDNDLGDVVLESTPVIASGRILVNGEPIARASFVNFQVEVRVGEEGSPRARWDNKPDLSVRVLEGGRFEVVGSQRRARHRVHTLWDLRHLPIQPLEFDVGAENLEIHLRSGGALTASALVDDGINLDNILFLLEPLDGQVPEPEDPQLMMFGSWNDRLRGRFTERRDDRSVFRWMSVWPGRYRFSVSVRGESEPLFEVADVRVAPGSPNEDARLEGIDLRGKLRVIRLRIVDQDGRPILFGEWGQPMVAINDRTPGATLGAFNVEEGSVSIPTSAAYVDLLVLQRGYRPAEVNAVTRDTTVALEKFPEVTIRIAGGMPELPSDYALRVSLRAKEPVQDDRELDSNFSSGHVMSWLRPATSTQLFEEGGQLRVPVAEDGEHTLRISVFDKAARRSVSVRGSEPADVEVRTAAGEQVFEVRLPPDGLRAAIEQLGRER